MNNFRMVELFSGSGNMAKTFKRFGYKTLTVDLIEDADIKKDIRLLNPQEIIDYLGDYPYVVWASPPCTSFSVCQISKNFKNGKPYSHKSFEGIELLTHTFRLIMALQPTYWYIENPRGMMRSLPIMDKLHKKTFTFCQYGDNAQKPTDVWTNNYLFFPKKCNAGDPCHDYCPRGSNKGTQGKNNAKERGTLPIKFCEYVESVTL